MSANMRLIITHPGGAHRDDFLAVCLLQAIHYGKFAEVVPVERRDPTDKELADPTVFVVDVGGQYNEALHNFDHHQMPAGTQECALSLVAKWHRVHEDMECVFPWYYTTIMLDSNGPTKTEEWLNVPGAFTPALQSPIENTMLWSFAEYPNVHSEIFVMIGQRILEQAQYLFDAVQTVGCSIFSVQGVKCLLTETDDSEVSALKSETIADDIETAIMINYDNRGEGLSILRINDHPQVDFSKLGEEPEVLFAHSAGFIMKTHEKIDIEALKVLISKGIVSNVTK